MIKLKPRWAFLIGLIALTVIILWRLNDGRVLLEVIKQADPKFILLAFLSEGIYYLIFSRLHQQVLRLYQINWRLSEVLPLVFTATMVNALAPFGPLSSAPVFAQKAKSKNLSRLHATAALFMVALMDFLGLAVFLIFSFTLLIKQHQLITLEIIALLIFSLLIGGLILILSGALTSWLVRLPFAWLRERLIRWQNIAKAFKPQRGRLLGLLPTSFLLHCAHLGTVAMLFLAFHQYFGFFNIVIIYSLLILFIISVPTPQGLGVVETLIPLILHSRGLSIEAATLIILCFRALSMWLPAALGAISLPLILRQNR